MANHTFFTIDGHTCGNPVRVVAGGAPALTGSTMIERRAHFLAEFDWVRTALMFEPRGHDIMSGSILYPPTRPDCDIAILFIETSGCLPMCGHGTIGTVTIAIERGLVQPKTPGRLRLDTPAGVVEAEYKLDGPHVEWVRITNVPAFLYATGLEADVPGLGSLSVDVAYGGNFYAIVEPQPNYPGLEQFQASQVAGVESDRAQGLRRKLPVRASRKTRDWGALACDVDGKAVAARQHCAQRRVLRRQGDRQISVRNRHVGAHGAMGSAREAEGRRGLRAREHHRLAIHGPHRGAHARRQSRCHHSLDFRGWARVTGFNTLFVDDRDPYWKGFQVVDRA